MKAEIILIGAGGHALSCIDVIETQGMYRIAGLVGLPAEKLNEELGYSVIGTDDELVHLATKFQHVLVAVGQIKTAEPRKRIYRQITNLGFTLPTIVSPTAYVSRLAKIGQGTIVMHGAKVNAGARIGNNCIINTNALIEHGTIVEDHCHISTGAILNGRVSVGPSTFVGSGCLVKEGVRIGESCLLGIGVIVRSDVADKVCILDNLF
jgi:sugar O-acyltransferase (sialic acid O-acetyltransferase NeuD family)